MGGGFSSSTYNGNPCLPPLENSLPCMAWVAWVDQSGTLCKCFIDSWHLDLRCHYLLNYPINCCMHILFQHYISTVIDEYTIHFDGSYWKYDEMVDQKEVNFSRGAHSTNPCGIFHQENCCQCHQKSFKIGLLQIILKMLGIPCVFFNSSIYTCCLPPRNRFLVEKRDTSCCKYVIDYVLSYVESKLPQKLA